MLSKNVTFLLSRRGRAVTYTSYADGTYTPGTGYTGGSGTDYTVKCYFSEYMSDEIDGTNVLFSDSKVLMSVEDTSGTSLPAPDNDDVVDGLTVVGVQTIYNAETKVAYIAQCRK